MNLPAEVRAEMGRQNIRPAHLSELSGINEATISRKVTNEIRTLDLAEAEALAQALGVPLWELMRRAEHGEGAAA